MSEVLVERMNGSLVLSVVYRVHFQCHRGFLVVCVLISDWLPYLISPRLSCEYLNEILYMILESWHYALLRSVECPGEDRRGLQQRQAMKKSVKHRRNHYYWDSRHKNPGKKEKMKQMKEEGVPQNMK